MDQFAKARAHFVFEPAIDFGLGPEVAHTVLDPLKVRYGHAARIAENVGDDKYALFVKYFVRLWRCRPVGPLGQYLALETAGIFGCDLIFGRAWSKHVTVKLK